MIFVAIQSPTDETVQCPFASQLLAGAEKMEFGTEVGTFVNSPPCDCEVGPVIELLETLPNWLTSIIPVNISKKAVRDVYVFIICSY